MALIDRVKARTGSDLPDTELSAMIAAIVADMDARFGPDDEIVVELGDPTDPLSSAMRTLRLPRPADPWSPMTIVERDPGNRETGPVTLDPADYRLIHVGRTLQRLTDGPHGRSFWAPLVTVTYVPAGEQAAREEAVIKLMQLDLSYRGGLKSERAGDYQYTLSEDHAAERERIFASLSARQGMMMA